MDNLELLACDWASRPRGAPTFADLAPAVRAVARQDGALVADYDPSAAAMLGDVVAAERLCCASIEWELEGTRLRVRATPTQLDVLAGAITGA